LRGEIDLADIEFRKKLSIIEENPEAWNFYLTYRVKQTLTESQYPLVESICEIKPIWRPSQLPKDYIFNTPLILALQFVSNIINTKLVMNCKDSIDYLALKKECTEEEIREYILMGLPSIQVHRWVSPKWLTNWKQFKYAYAQGHVIYIQEKVQHICFTSSW
jgi:hypothetical protein